MPLTAEQRDILAECDRTNARLRQQGLGRAGVPAFASAARRPASRPTSADEDYSRDFLAKLSQRAGIPASEDPEQILAALDLRLFALQQPKQSDEDRRYAELLKAMDLD